MAWLQKIEGNFHISFRFGGQKFKRSLKTKISTEAHTRKARLEETIRLVESGRMDVPNDADVATFLLSDGKIPQKNGALKKSDPNGSVTLKSTFDAFFDAIPDGSLEDDTLKGMHRHERHLFRLIGGAFPLGTLSLEHLQMYVNKRAKEDTHYGTKVTATTINKELVTLGTVWRWAERMGKVVGTFSRRGVRLPKTSELPPFQTWEEIERKTVQDGLDGSAAGILWDALYLRRSEIDELLTHVQSHTIQPHVYPMFIMAAHTGARRAELLRSHKSDFDFDGSVVTIRERKRVRGRHTTRRVPLSPTLSEVMHKWISSDHPGGTYTFCHAGPVNGHCTRMTPGDPISPDQVHDNFENALAGSKWEKIKGWHCLRHSFISNLASQGIDQRIIDDFVGHTTEQMRRRYRHLFPDVRSVSTILRQLRDEISVALSALGG